MLLNPITFYFLDPSDLHKSIKEFDEAIFRDIVKIEKKNQKGEESVAHLVNEALKIEQGEPLSTVDLYSLLECPKRHAATNEELTAHYKLMILRFHPDKCHHLGIKDELFKAIQLAYDLLTDPKTRKSYDSMDPYTQPKVPHPDQYTNPSTNELIEDAFYDVFDQYFNQLSHFAMNSKKMPSFKATSSDKIAQFYTIWLKYTSWRTFDLDSIMELRSTSGGREERRHRQKELQKEWETQRRTHAVETSEMIQLAMRLDPRCQQLKAKEQAEKASKKEALKQRKIEMAAKRNGGKLPVQPTKKIIIKQVVKPTSSSAGVPWSKEESAALIQAIKKIPGGAKERFEQIAKEIKKQTKTSFIRSKAEVIEQMELIQSGDAGNIKALQTKVEKSGDVTEATIDYDRKVVAGDVVWTKEEQKQLEAAMKQYSDKTDGQRWDKIADMVEGKTKKECVARCKAVQQSLKKNKS